MTYYTKYDYIMIRRHWIVMIFKYLRFSFYIIISLILLYVSYNFSSYISKEIRYYVFFPIIFLSINYAFFKLILNYIKYYNNLLILHKNQLMVIKSTLLDTDNVEIIDLNKTTKLDTFIKWLIPNIIWYGTLVIEQQRDQVREFWYVPKPYKAIWYLNEAKIKNFKK